MITSTYKTGDRVRVDVGDGDWKEAKIIGQRVRANGLLFYRMSVAGWQSTPWVTAKRIEPK